MRSHSLFAVLAVLAPLLVIGCAGEPDRIVIEYTMADGGTPAAPGGNKGGDLEGNLGGHGGGQAGAPGGGWGAAAGAGAAWQGGGKAGGGVGGAPGVADPALARKLCEGTLVAQATNLTSCCSAADQSTQEFYWSTLDDAATAAACEGLLDQSMARGRIVLAPAGVDQCVGAYQGVLAARACAVIREFPLSVQVGAACDGAVIGLQPLGNACSFSYECADGLTCEGYTDVKQGQCEPPGAANHPCGGRPSEEFVNPASFVELPFSPTPLCSAGLLCEKHACRPTLPVGSPCTFDLPCAPELVCSIRSSTCVKRRSRTIDEPCSWSAECEEGLYCEGGSATSGFCAPLKSSGQLCDGPGECVGACSENWGSAKVCVPFCGSG
jgi:hypothetical protein